MKYLFRSGGPQINTFISIEPGGFHSVTNGALGSHRYKVIFEGPGGHSWGSFGLANPVHALGQSVSAFVEEADQFTKKGIKTSYNIGRIEGGTSVNSVPFSVWMEIDMRSLSPERLDSIDAIFHRSMQIGVEHQNKIRRTGDPVTLKIEMIGNRPSGHTDPMSSLVQRSLATSRYLNAEPKLSTSSTDSNIPISKGIPAVTLGGGGKTGNAHSLREWYYNQDGYKGIQRILLVIVSEAGID